MTSVLLVDDESSLLEIGKDFLESEHGLIVNTADSAMEGLNRFKNARLDVIVSDFQMPNMDGIEFLKNIRKIDGNFPFILFTGRGHEEVAINALNNGADFYLKKEGSPKVMYTELANMVERSALRYRLESQLKETLQLLADAEVMGMMGCWEYNFADEECRYSKELLEILRLTESSHDIVDPKFLEMALEEDREKIAAMVEATRTRGRISAAVIRIKVEPDEIRTCYLKIRPVADNSGNVFKLSGILQDITSISSLNEKTGSWSKW